MTIRTSSRTDTRFGRTTRNPKLPLVLYVPHDLADEFEQIGRDVWSGRGTVVGWDNRHGRLQVKIET